MQSLVSNRCCFLIVLVLLVMLASISVSNAFKAGGNMQLLTLCVSCVCVGSFVLAGAVDPGIVWNDSSMMQEIDPEKEASLVYCSVCGVCRPLNANRCTLCNACYEGYS